VAGRKGMTDLSGGGSGASVTTAGLNVYSNSNASSRPKNLGDESRSDDSELESDDDDDIIIIYHSDFNSCSNKIKTWQYTYIHTYMDALHDVHEKIKMKKEREMHAQQQQQQPQQYQQPPYEIRDPHGILYLLRSRL